MSIKKFIIIFSILILNVFVQKSAFCKTFSSDINANNKSFPTNLNEDNFIKLESFNGKIVAFDGKIEQIKTSRLNTPFYKLKINNNKYLWTALMFNNQNNNQVGDTIRVVGFLRPIIEDEISSTEKKYLDGSFMVLAMGLVDIKNSNFLFLDGAEIQKQDWISGKIPKQ